MIKVIYRLQAFLDEKKNQIQIYTRESSLDSEGASLSLSREIQSVISGVEAAIVYKQFNEHFIRKLCVEENDHG